jgi:hypothetical protein
MYIFVEKWIHLTLKSNNNIFYLFIYKPLEDGPWTETCSGESYKTIDNFY